MTTGTSYTSLIICFAIPDLSTIAKMAPFFKKINNSPPGAGPSGLFVVSATTFLDL
jgi:hypothetical protein